MATAFAFLGCYTKDQAMVMVFRKLMILFFENEKPLAFGQVYAMLGRLIRGKKMTMATVIERYDQLGKYTF